MIGRLAVRGRVSNRVSTQWLVICAPRGMAETHLETVRAVCSSILDHEDVCVSDLEVQAVQRRVSPEKIVVIANGLDLDEWMQRATNPNIRLGNCWAFLECKSCRLRRPSNEAKGA